MLTINSVRFDVTGWTRLPESPKPNHIVYRNGHGDVLVHGLDDTPHNCLPAPLSDLSALRNHYRTLAINGNMFNSGPGALVSVDVFGLGGVGALRSILMFRDPKSEHGFLYMGEWKLVFVGFCYTIMVTAVEHGETGTRHAIVGIRHMQGLSHDAPNLTPESVRESQGRPALPGVLANSETIQARYATFMCDPYDPTFKAPRLRTMAENEAYDTMFPDHPLSRVRRYMHHIATTLVMTDEVRTSPQPVGPVH